MGEALWADVATTGLGGGPGRKRYRSGHCVGIPATGCSEGTGDWAGRRGSRMITSLAARRGALTPRAGKEAGAGVGSRRMGSWSPPSVQKELGRLELGAGRGWEGSGEKALL